MKRWLMCVMILSLLGAGAAVADWSGDAAPPAAEFGLTTTGWRRTTNGWEHESLWRNAQVPPGLRLSPLVVGTLEALTAIGALVLFERRATA